MSSSVQTSLRNYAYIFEIEGGLILSSDYNKHEALRIVAIKFNICRRSQPTS